MPDSVNRGHKDRKVRKIAAESYPVMKVIPAAAQGSRDQCLERIKHTMTSQLPDIYRTVKGQLTDITVRVTDKYRVKQKFEERLCTGQGSHVLLSSRRFT